MSKKRRYEEVKELFNKKEYTLLDDKYVNNKTKMSYEDKNGYRYEITYNSILTNGEDVICRQPIASSTNKWSMYNINLYLKLNNETCKLLSHKYVNQNTAMDWLCENGHIFHTNWGNFQHKGFRCGKCAIENRMYSFSDCKEMVERRVGYKLVDLERRKNTNGYLVIYYNILHSCGHTYWISKQEFDSGNECRPCAMEESAKRRRKSDKTLIREVSDATNMEYSYVKSEYRKLGNGKSVRFVQVIHNTCGNKYWVSYSNWKSGQRCPECVYVDMVKVSKAEWKNRIECLNKHNFKLLKVYFKKRSDNGRNESWTKLKCMDCGAEIDRTASSWKNGCVYCHTSKGEEKIRELLLNNNIKYIAQKEFDGLTGVNGGKLSYDFYLPSYNTLIEYQGEFHDGTDRMKDKSYLPIQQEHDRRKREYAIEHNVGLLEIWYWDFDNIEQILNDKIILK